MNEPFENAKELIPVFLHHGKELQDAQATLTKEQVQDMCENFLRKMAFLAFERRVQKYLKAGMIQTDGLPLNRVEIACQYAVGKEMEEAGKKTLTSIEIIDLVKKHCGIEIYKEIFEHAFEPGNNLFSFDKAMKNRKEKPHE